ncbi:MAG: acyltransferase family protein [Burkholderiaceae bacterium]
MSSSVKSSESSAEMALSHPKYRPDIDGLRAVAVLSVVIYHAFPDALKAGFMGVDIFFVISGYLISSIIFENIDRGSFSFGQFYGRRIKRIFPALTLVLLSCLVFGWFGLLGDEFKQLGKHMAAGAGFVSNFYLWQESGYFNNAAETKPLLHLWSLAIEEQFYIVWPLIVWLTWKRKWLFLSVFIGLGVASFAYNVHLVRLDPTATFFSPATRIWELLAGVLLAYMKVRPTAWQPSQRQLHVAATLGVALLAFGLYRIDKGRPYPGTWALLPILGSFCLIFAGPTAWFNRLVLSNRLLVWVGLISFPLYLWHWPMLSFMRIVESEAPSLGYRVLAVGLSVLLAWITYYFVEKPIRANGKSTLKIVVLTTCVAALGLAGLVIFQNNGVTTRAAAQINGVNTWDNLTFATPCKFITNGPNHDDWCNIGNAPDKPPTTLLIGDSVGNNFAPMLQRYSEQAGDSALVFRQFGRGLCHGFPEIAYENCAELVNATRAYLAITPSVDTIILAANWPLYFNGFDRVGSTPVRSEQFKAAFETNVAYYQGLGKRVIVFLAPPVGANPRACLTRPIRLSDKSSCNLALAEALHNDGQYRAYFTMYLKSIKVDTFDPFKYMCDETSCKVTDGTRIYYVDHEHFSAFGGQFLADVSKDDLKNLLGTVRK